LLARGTPLFQRAAIHSSACVFEPVERASEFAQEIADALGCSTLECLRSASTLELLTARPSPPSMTQSSRHNLASTLALEAFESSVPLIVGSNADELLATAPDLPTREAFVSLLATELGTERAAAIRELYFDQGQAPRDAYAQALGDARYHCHAERTATLPAPAGARYRFVLDRPLDGEGQRPLGSYHGLDLIYLFGTFEEVGYEPSVGDRAFSDQLMQFYAAFAWTGVPAAPQIWPRHDFTGETLMLSDELATAQRPRTQHCAFWAEVGAAPRADAEP
jgi:carboxylesterase type B